MTIAELLWATVGAIAVVGIWGGLLYVTLFKPKESNYPIAMRGLGICLLAGTLKVLFIFGEWLSPAFGAALLDYALIAMFVSGMLMMMGGFAQGGSE